MKFYSLKAQVLPLLLSLNIKDLLGETIQPFKVPLYLVQQNVIDMGKC